MKLAQRVAYTHALTVGQGVQEYEATGKAALEVLQYGKPRLLGALSPTSPRHSGQVSWKSNSTKASSTSSRRKWSRGV